MNTQLYLGENMTITLQNIKEQQNKVAEMIAAFEANAKLSAAFPITINFPTLNAGEQYVGAIISANGAKREHIILLPAEVKDMKWQAAMDWAASIGGHLPDRCESSLLFATMKDQFKPEWYWTCEQGAAVPDYAWLQGFDYGNQYGTPKSGESRARAVRRLLIIE
jgi:hypothetical protein